jgi:LysR family transcriptional regulator, pca operon transcriptional activator
MTGDNIKFRHLQCFLAVAQQGSLQRAAVALSITQPAVSKTLKELESLLDTRLFERGRKGAALTPAGEAFTRHAGASVSALRDAVASVTPSRRPGAEVVTLGVLPTVAPWLLPAVLGLLDTSGARTSLRIHTAPNPALLLQLRQRELDLVIGRFAEPVHMQGLTFEHLYADPLVLVVRPGHPLLHGAALRGNPLMHLHGFTLVLPPQGTAIRHTADSFLSTRGLVSPARTIETLSVSVARNHTRASDAVWLSPRGAAAQDVRDGTLTPLAVDMTGTEELVGLSLRADADMSAAQNQVLACIRIAAQQAAKLSFAFVATR